MKMKTSHQFMHKKNLSMMTIMCSCWSKNGRNGSQRKIISWIVRNRVKILILRKQNKKRAFKTTKNKTSKRIIQCKSYS